MAQQHIHEGTPQQLAAWLGNLPEEKRYRLVVEEEPEEIEETLDAKLHRWQRHDGTPLMSDVPTQTLFALWAEEDAHMTDEEREAEDRLWEDMERGLAKNSGLQLRHLG